MADANTQRALHSIADLLLTGPVQFDAPGQWTVRFHLHDNCSDEPADSPHGHAAFFIGVP